MMYSWLVGKAFNYALAAFGIMSSDILLSVSSRGSTASDEVHDLRVALGDCAAAIAVLASGLADAHGQLAESLRELASGSMDEAGPVSEGMSRSTRRVALYLSFLKRAVQLAQVTSDRARAHATSLDALCEGAWSPPKGAARATDRSSVDTKVEIHLGGAYAVSQGGGWRPPPPPMSSRSSTAVQSEPPRAAADLSPAITGSVAVHVEEAVGVDHGGCLAICLPRRHRRPTAPSEADGSGMRVAQQPASCVCGAARIPPLPAVPSKAAARANADATPTLLASPSPLPPSSCDAQQAQALPVPLLKLSTLASMPAAEPELPTHRTRRGSEGSGGLQGATGGATGDATGGATGNPSGGTEGGTEASAEAGGADAGGADSGAGRSSSSAAANGESDDVGGSAWELDSSSPSSRESLSIISAAVDLAALESERSDRSVGSSTVLVEATPFAALRTLASELPGCPVGAPENAPSPTDAAGADGYAPEVATTAAVATLPESARPEYPKAAQVSGEACDAAPPTAAEPSAADASRRSVGARRRWILARGRSSSSNASSADGTLTEADPFPSGEVEGGVYDEVVAALGEGTAASAPPDVLVRGIRAFQHEKRRRGRAWAACAVPDLEKVLSWRQSSNIEACASAEPGADDGAARFDALWRCEPCGVDSWGRPCVWDRIGAANLAGLLDELGESTVIHHFLIRLERLRLRKLRESAERGHAVYKHVFVVDLAGLSMGVLRRENREMLVRVAHTLQHSYPESMHRVLIVNSPRLFSVCWSMLRPLIDPVSAAKFAVLGSHHDETVRQTLLEAGVDADFLDQIQ